MQILQKPNKSSLIASISLILSLLTQGVLHQAFLILGVFAGIIWSHGEVVFGINIIRKLFGLIGFIALTIYLILNT